MTASGHDWQEVRRGFAAMLPFWLGVVPFAVTFALLARSSGFSTLEIQALSVLVFAGSAQLAFINLAKDGAGSLAILLTVLLLNLRHVLYGLSLNVHLPPRTRPGRPVLAAMMTDESYGLTIRTYRDGRGSDGFFFGASISLFLAFAAATCAGALLGAHLPDPDRLGLEVVFPLSFLALLLPMLRTRLDLTVAAVAGGLALVAGQVFGSGVVMLVATAGGAGAGTLLDRRALVGRV
jgi:4-azaleucine resistance transporter AzlC